MDQDTADAISVMEKQMAERDQMMAGLRADILRLNARIDKISDLLIALSKGLAK